MTYYNEIDPTKAAWLRELIRAGLLPYGDVDTRSIEHLTLHDLEHYTSHHFFAGVGGWPLALRLSGWPDDSPVWTGSCPCQPFSQSGKRRCAGDARDLWPDFFHLIASYEPSVVFGEQVASPDGCEWLARVRADLEAVGFAVGAADLCSAGVGAPHRRSRIHWVAYANRSRPQGHLRHDSGNPQLGPDRACAPGHRATPSCHNFWSSFGVVPYAGKKSRIQPGVLPLVDGVSARVVRLRGYGDAINPRLAAEFVSAFVEAMRESQNQSLILSDERVC
jgi:DNA (cytosine-5)-methyltransferase 1